MKKSFNLFAPLLCTFLLSGVSFSQDETVNTEYENVTPKNKAPLEIIFKADDFKTCGDTLNVDGHLLIMDSTDYNSCSFGSQDSVLWLYPATLAIQLNSNYIHGWVEKVTIEYVDFCRPGCFSVVSKNSDWIAADTQSNTVTGEPAKFEIQHIDMRYLYITGGESQITKIIIEYTP